MWLFPRDRRWDQDANRSLLKRPPGAGLTLGRPRGDRTAQIARCSRWRRGVQVFQVFPSTLMLVRVSSEDEAIYQCVAENSTGSNQASASLAVTGDPEPPLAPRGLQAMAVSSSAIGVSWEAPPSDRAVIGYALPLRCPSGLWEVGVGGWAGVPGPSPRPGCYVPGRAPHSVPPACGDARWPLVLRCSLCSSALSRPSSNFCSPCLLSSWAPGRAHAYCAGWGWMCRGEGCWVAKPLCS